MSKNKHLTNDERLQIEHLLSERTSLSQIAKQLGKSKSTVSREVRARSIIVDKGARYRIRNRCVRRADCNRYYLCEDKTQCARRCSACNLCNEICPDFEEQICYKLFEPPYVCNGCMDEHQCVLGKRFYINKKAHEAYREMLTESRAGANISEDELLALDEMVSPLIGRGQSLHHIVASNADKFNISERSIYRYVDSGLLTARNIDMPRVCRMKPRKTKPVIHKVDSSCRIGRTYAEYEAFITETALPAVEMDSVIGRVGGKVLLTLMFTSCDFMLAFIRERNTSQSVIDAFDILFKLLGPQTFKALFPLLLTDNGSEFSNPLKLEFDAEGNRRTRIFYCDPQASFQKPHVELNHEFIRRILPKGTSFDNFLQDDVNLMMSHINSYPREKLSNKPPLDLFGFLHGWEPLEKLGISKIPASEILLKPALLKK
jgi:IS30 family transposase